MNPQEREEFKRLVRDAVHEQLPEELVSVLEPMTRRSTRAVLRRYSRAAVIGFVLLSVAASINFIRLGEQADRNSSTNHRQDCALVGLIVGVSRTDHDPQRNYLYHKVIAALTAPHRCDLPVIPTPPHS